MSRTWLGTFVFVSFVVSDGLAARPARANPISLDLTPSTFTVMPGQIVAADIVIGGTLAGGAPSIGAFDLHVAFASDMLSPIAVSFTTLLGDPALAEVLTDVRIMPGVFNAAAVSLLSPADLDLLQPADFTLVTLSFQALAAGTTQLTLARGWVTDAFGDVLVDVEIPEPTSFALVASGTAALLARAHRRRARVRTGTRTRARRIAIGVAVIGGCLIGSSSVSAFPIHEHCDIAMGWGPLEFNANIIPDVPVVNPINVILRGTLEREAPTTTEPNCAYELSDVTEVLITLRIAAPGDVERGTLEFAGLGINGRTPIDPVQGPFTFRDGVGLTFQFPMHLNSPGDIHILFPNPMLEIVLLGGQSAAGTSLIGAEVRALGFDYFLVPEPASVWLMALGLGGMIVRSRSARRLSS